jgi:hypothetical protein
VDQYPSRLTTSTDHRDHQELQPMSHHIHRWVGDARDPGRQHWTDHVLCALDTGQLPTHDHDTARPGVLTVSTQNADVTCPDCLEWIHA